MGFTEQAKTNLLKIFSNYDLKNESPKTGISPPTFLEQKDINFLNNFSQNLKIVKIIPLENKFIFLANQNGQGLIFFVDENLELIEFNYKNSDGIITKKKWIDSYNDLGIENSIFPLILDGILNSNNELVLIWKLQNNQIQIANFNNFLENFYTFFEFILLDTFRLNQNLTIAEDKVFNGSVMNSALGFKLCENRNNNNYDLIFWRSSKEEQDKFKKYFYFISLDFSKTKVNLAYDLGINDADYNFVNIQKNTMDLETWTDEKNKIKGRLYFSTKTGESETVSYLRNERLEKNLSWTDNSISENPKTFSVLTSNFGEKVPDWKPTHAWKKSFFIDAPFKDIQNYYNDLKKNPNISNINFTLKVARPWVQAELQRLPNDIATRNFTYDADYVLNDFAIYLTATYFWKTDGANVYRFAFNFYLNGLPFGATVEMQNTNDLYFSNSLNQVYLTFQGDNWNGGKNSLIADFTYYERFQQTSQNGAYIFDIEEKDGKVVDGTISFAWKDRNAIGNGAILNGTENFYNSFNSSFLINNSNLFNGANTIYFNKNLSVDAVNYSIAGAYNNSDNTKIYFFGLTKTKEQLNYLNSSAISPFFQLSKSFKIDSVFLMRQQNLLKIFCFDNIFSQCVKATFIYNNLTSSALPYLWIDYNNQNYNLVCSTILSKKNNKIIGDVNLTNFAIVQNKVIELFKVKNYSINETNNKWTTYSTSNNSIFENNFILTKNNYEVINFTLLNEIIFFNKTDNKINHYFSQKIASVFKNDPDLKNAKMSVLRFFFNDGTFQDWDASYSWDFYNYPNQEIYFNSWFRFTKPVKKFQLLNKNLDTLILEKDISNFDYSNQNKVLQINFTVNFNE